jgi:spore coat polysaccharide biosynthesis predicted glycosyltransferase SpsG
MQVVVVVEGGPEAGLGHVYHSAALADTLDESITCTFVSKSGTETVEKIRDLGHQVIEVGTDAELIETVRDMSPAVVIVDVPRPKAKFFADLQGELPPSVSLLVFGNRNENLSEGVTTHCDIVVDFDTGGEANDRQRGRYYDETTDTWQLIGLQYLMLRPDFHDIDHTAPVSDGFGRVMIQFGAADPSNYTTRVVDRLLSSDVDFEIEVILGAGFSHEDALNRVLNTYPSADRTVTVARDVSDVARRMTDADVVVTSPGLSMFEALLTKTPVIAIYQNDLQKIYQGYEFVHSPAQLDSIEHHIQETHDTFTELTADLKLDMHTGRQQLIDLIEDQCQ